jgi:hypothetical protein
MELLSILQKNKKYFYYGILTIFLIAVAISLWYFNIAPIDIIVNWIAGLSTLFAAIFVLFTLFEMKAQRLSTYKPAIFVKNSTIMVKWDKEPQGPLDFSIEGKYAVESDEKNDHSKGFECYNIGLGAAQRIHISYTFNLQKMIEKIKELDKDLKVPIKFQNSALVIGNKRHLRAYPEEITDKIHIDYLLPTNIDSIPTYIPLPELFTDLFSVYLYLLMNSLEKSDESSNKIAEVNKCNMIIKYQDIGNEQYIKKHEIELFLMMSQGDAIQKITGSWINIKVRELDK